MTKWEYLVVDRREVSLNEMGEDGWELAAVTENSHYFKRPVVEKEHWIKMVNIVKEDCNCPVCSECRDA